MIALDIKVENTYVDGYEETRQMTVEVEEPPSPATEDEMSDWALDNLFPYTGTNTGRENVDALYEVTVLFSELPEVLPAGTTFDWGG